MREEKTLAVAESCVLGSSWVDRENRFWPPCQFEAGRTRLDAGGYACPCRLSVHVAYPPPPHTQIHPPERLRWCVEGVLVMVRAERAVVSVL